MKITPRLKNLARIAKEKYNYKYISCVVGSYMATTYCNFWLIDEVLNAKTGAEFVKKPFQCSFMWTGWPNTRQSGNDTISYSSLFALEKSPNR